MSRPEGCMLRYYITDGGQLPSSEALVMNIARQMAAGVEIIQLRERNLATSQLQMLAEEVLRLPNPRGSKILINDRSDVALAVGASGVHLRGNAIAPWRIRNIAAPDFLIGVSCHTVEEVRRAAGEGASFAVLAPIYATPGKGPALGLGPLEEAARAVRIPVLALGGVNEERFQDCMTAGAAGIAGISLFQAAARNLTSEGGKD